MGVIGQSPYVEFWVNLPFTQNWPSIHLKYKSLDLSFLLLLHCLGKNFLNNRVLKGVYHWHLFHGPLTEPFVIVFQSSLVELA